MDIDKKPLIDDLISSIGEENIIQKDEELIKYGQDRFGKKHTPLLVVKPTSSSHFKRLNFILRRHKIDSITPRGKALGINLGAYSEDLVIDLTVLNTKVEIDIQNLILHTQAGVSYKNIQNKLKKKGFRLPIEPVINGTIGGFIASGGYGYGSWHYGTIMNFLRNTTFFLSNGQNIETGTTDIPPYACGYNLNSLVCGSEGYFGIITDAVLEIVPIAENYQNLLLSIRNKFDLIQILTKIIKFSTIYNISLYKAFLNDDTNSFDVSIRLEGPKKAIEHASSEIRNIQGINLYDSDRANRLWEDRILEPIQIPDTKRTLETIIPIKYFSQFLSFSEKIEIYSAFGLLLNANNILLYLFLPKEQSDSQESKILAKFFQKINDFHAYPPTIGNRHKKFVENSYPNLKILKMLKPIFDETNRLKSRRLQF